MSSSCQFNVLTLSSNLESLLPFKYSNYQVLFLFQPLFKARAKNVQNFVGFLEDGRTWYFAFDIY